MDRMPVKLPDNVRAERTRHGKIVFYHRIGHGKRTRIKGDPKSDEFAMEAARLNANPAQQPSTTKKYEGGTLLWLVNLFESQDPTLLNLKPSTHQVYTDILRRIAEVKPNRKFQSITTQNINEGMMKRTPAAANNMLRAVRKLFDWAVSMGLADANPTDGIRKRKAPKADTHTWTEEEIAFAREKWPSGTRERLALEIGASGGLARADAVKFGPTHIDEHGCVRLPRTKTGVVMEFYVPAELQTEIDQAPLGFTFFQTKAGRPMKDTAFGTWFARQCDNIKLPKECRFHGLRRYCATSKANKRYSAHQLMTWFGWESISEAQLYTQKADRSRIARESQEQEKNERIPHLQTEIPHLRKSSSNSKG